MALTKSHSLSSPTFYWCNLLICSFFSRLKEAENDILEVMSGIENVDEPGEDDEHALLTHCFRELKDDLVSLEILYS